MRLLPASLGVAVVPLSYLTLRGLDCAWPTALLGSLFILFENGLITQSRHILLDSPLIFFTSLTTFCWVAFSNEDRDRRRAFTEKWWLWLILTGLSLGAVVSCKWVGLFTIATIGLSTLRQLWILLGDLKVSPRLFMKHFLARALCLIILPAFFYMIMFAIHFQILQNSGDGDGFMSSAFQHTLGGKGMGDTYAGKSGWPHDWILTSDKFGQMSLLAPKLLFDMSILRVVICTRTTTHIQVAVIVRMILLTLMLSLKSSIA